MSHKNEKIRRTLHFEPKQVVLADVEPRKRRKLLTKLLRQLRQRPLCYGSLAPTARKHAREIG
jgi:hypothetical protein